MNTFEKTTEAIARRIAVSIEKNRIAKELVGYVLGDVDPRTIHRIWKSTGEYQVTTSPGGAVTMIAPRLRLEYAQVVTAGLEQKGDFDAFIRKDSGIFIDAYLDHLGMEVAHQENDAVISNLINEAKDLPATQGELTRSDILVAAKWIGTKQCSANTVVVNPEQEFELIENKEIISRWSFSPQQWIGKDQHCCGILDGMDVYSTPHMPKGLSLVYDKNETFLSRTPLIIRFDDPSSPKSLLIEEQCVAWARNSNGVAEVRVGAISNEGTSDHKPNPSIA